MNDFAISSVKTDRLTQLGGVSVFYVVKVLSAADQMAYLIFRSINLAADKWSTMVSPFVAPRVRRSELNIYNGSENLKL